MCLASPLGGSRESLIFGTHLVHTGVKNVLTYFFFNLTLCPPSDASTSRMFQDFPSDIMKAVTQEPLTGNFHRYGVSVKVPQKQLK